MFGILQCLYHAWVYVSLAVVALRKENYFVGIYCLSNKVLQPDFYLNGWRRLNLCRILGDAMCMWPRQCHFSKVLYFLKQFDYICQMIDTIDACCCFCFIVLTALHMCVVRIYVKWPAIQTQRKLDLEQKKSR